MLAILKPPTVTSYDNVTACCDHVRTLSDENCGIFKDIRKWCATRTDHDIGELEVLAVLLMYCKWFSHTIWQWGPRATLHANKLYPDH
jgi:hypothetical protein